jgi:hypothetical protein
MSVHQDMQNRTNQEDGIRQRSEKVSRMLCYQEENKRREKQDGTNASPTVPEASRALVILHHLLRSAMLPAGALAVSPL